MKNIRIKKNQSEMYGGILIGIFSLLFYFYIIPRQIKDIEKAIVSPQTLPKLLVLMIFVLSVLLVLVGYRKKDLSNQKVYEISISEIKLVAITVGIIIIYILVVDFLGYILTTGVSIAVLMYIFGQRKKSIIILTAVIIPIIINLFFTNLMKIYLP